MSAIVNPGPVNPGAVNPGAANPGAANPGVVAHAADDLRVEDLGTPEPGPDEAIVEIAYGGICGSDLHYWRHGAAGASVLREPMVLGHEVSGTVVAAAADGSGPAVGTRVAVHPLTAQGDGRTPWPQDRPNLAPASSYLGSALHLPHTQGGFARRVALPSRLLHALPDGLSLEAAALAEPAAVAWHAVERAGDVRGKRVAVIGAGPIGQLVTAVARHHGAAEVIATDLHPLPRRIAEAHGATTIDATDAAAIAALHADVVVESSGTVPGLASAIEAAARGGTVVLLGLQRAGDVPAALATAITRELSLVGSFRFGAEFDEVIAALADGSLDVSGIVTHVRPVADAIAAFGIAADASASSKVLLAFGATDASAEASTEASSESTTEASALGAAPVGVPLIVMGVSGSGKSTVGAALGREFGMEFIDGDDLHPQRNKDKMAAGQPLDDDDRAPWLEIIALRIGSEFGEGRPIVVACSALKRRYREQLAAHAPATVFVHLMGDRELIAERQQGRVHEYMPTSLLASQFDALEPIEDDERGLRIDVHRSPEEIVDEVRRSVAAMPAAGAAALRPAAP